MRAGLIGVVGIIVALTLCGVLLRMVKRTLIDQPWMTPYERSLYNMNRQIAEIGMAFGRALIPALTHAAQAMNDIGQALLALKETEQP